MRRLLAAALALALILLFGSFACAEGEPEIFSCDFDLRFHLNTEVFPFREREEMACIRTSLVRWYWPRETAVSTISISFSRSIMNASI